MRLGPANARHCRTRRPKFRRRESKNFPGFSRRSQSKRDYWLQVNSAMFLVESQVTAMEEFCQPGLRRIMSNTIREQPVAGVDTELAAWARSVADLLELRAGILERAAEPRTVEQPAGLPRGSGDLGRRLSE
jgi:hypothetical protein